MSKKEQKQSSDEEFRQKMEKSAPKKEEDNQGMDALAEDILEQDSQIYPCLGIYGGHNGSFDMIENGEEITKPIEKKIYPLPMDTDIVKINAHTVRLAGYKDEVESIGSFTLNASYVEIEDCPALVKLPNMNRADVVLVNNAPMLRTLPAVMNVRELALKNTGIRYLPKSLARTKIALSGCSNLEYIHPAIPTKNFLNLKRVVVLALQSNYVLSDLVPTEEKEQYTLHLKQIQVSQKNLETLPHCFGRASIIIGDCPNLKYIHPEVSVKQIQGLTPKRICQCKMQYLFDKLSDDDDRFDHWFQRVKREIKASERVR